MHGQAEHLRREVVVEAFAERVHPGVAGFPPTGENRRRRKTARYDPRAVPAPWHRR